MFKPHISLNTTKLDESVKFYKTLFDSEPAKLKPGYAKFDIEIPVLNLALVEVAQINISKSGTNGCCSSEGSPLNHLGIQVNSSEEVWQAKERLQKAGLISFDEKDVNCCYALQDKIWVTDPNGYNWEIFVVKIQDTAPEITAETETAKCC